MELHCIFYSQNFDASYNCYRCLITNREIPVNKKLKLIGQHENNKTNENVTHVEFNNCKVKKIPQDLMKTFSNLKVLNILNSELRTICKEDLIGYENVERLICDFNEIEYLPGNLFEDFQNLELISFRGNELKIIEPNILDSLQNLQHVNIRDNPNYSKCYSILSCKDSNAELDDVKIQIVEKFFNLNSEIVEKFIKNLKNPIEKLKTYENMSKSTEVKLKIVNLRLKIFETSANKKIEQFRKSESNLNQEIKNLINFESKLIREINELRNFEVKLTNEIQELKSLNSGQILMRQQSEPAYHSSDNSFNVPVAALRQELQGWRNLANKLNLDVEKLKNSESKLNLKVQNLKISLQIEKLKNSILVSEADSFSLLGSLETCHQISKTSNNDQKICQNQSQTLDGPKNENEAYSSRVEHKIGHNSTTSNNLPSNIQNSFLIDIKKYIQDEITKDFIIKIGNQEFLVHKFLLAARSATLADLLNKNPFIDSLNLDNISSETFQLILRFIYTDEFPSEDEINFVELFDAAGRLRIEELKNFAGRQILDKVNSGNAIEIFNLSSKYEHKMLRQKSFEEIKKNYDSK